ncbi:MAG: hypothetical protein NW205_13925 [Hyphomicrobiaceae bacterium]|nr:hypothetical protein [Hyphomicrobiaceae bacterium]
MGAVHFSLDPVLVDALQSALPLRTLVETGTFKGDTPANLANRFDRIVTIELSDELWRAAADRLAAYPHIEALQGSSDVRLGERAASLATTPTLYWLDAHWCIAEGTAGETSQCPLLREIAAIGRLEANSVIAIDDARLFLSTPPKPHEASQWPRFQEIIDHLRQASPTHEIAVVNDVIVFFPTAARQAVERYARDHGTDWHQKMHRISVQDDIIAKLREGSAVQMETINVLRARVAELEAGKAEPILDRIKRRARQSLLGKG